MARHSLLHGTLNTSGFTINKSITSLEDPSQLMYQISSFNKLMFSKLLEFSNKTFSNRGRLGGEKRILIEDHLV